MRLLILVVIFLACFPASAQFQKQWEARYHPAGTNNESSTKVIIASGNRYILGRSGYNDYGDTFVSKYNSSGTLLWTYQTGSGTAIPDDSSPYDMAINADGTVQFLVLQNVANLFGSTKKTTLVKIDTDGKYLWHKTILDPVDFPTSPVKLDVDANGNIYCTTSSSGLKVQQFSSSGDLKWSVAFGGELGATLIDSNNNYIIVGNSGTFSGTRTPFLYIYDVNKNLLNNGSTTFTGLILNNFNRPTDITEKSGYYYIGFTNTVVTKTNLNGSDVSIITPQSSFTNTLKNHTVAGNDGFFYSVDVDGLERVTFRKMSSAGTIVWTKTYDASGSRRFPFANYLTSDNKMYVVCGTEEVSNVRTYHLIECLPDGTIRLIKDISGIHPTKYAFGAMSLDSSGNVTVSGSFYNGATLYDVVTTNLSISNGIVSWEKVFVAANDMIHRPEAVAADSEGSVYVAGMINDGIEFNEAIYPRRKYGLIKYDKNGNEIWVKKVEPEPNEEWGYQALAVAVTSQDEIVITGQNLQGENDSSIGETPVNMFTLKYNKNGNLLWQAEYEMTPDQIVFGHDIKIQDNGNIYVIAYMRSAPDGPANREEKLMLVAYSPAGSFLWSKVVGHITSEYGRGSSSGSFSYRPHLRLIDGGILLIYSDHSVDEHPNNLNIVDLIAQKFDYNGNEIFRKAINLPILDPSYSTTVMYPIGVDLISNGNLSVLVKGRHSGQGPSGYVDENHHVVYQLDPTGDVIDESIYSYDRDITYSSDFISGAHVVDTEGSNYSLMFLSGKLVFQKRSSSGEVLWTVERPGKLSAIGGSDESNPSFAFMKKNGNPVFFTTSRVVNNTDNFFMIEFNAGTGDEISNSFYDGGLDVPPTNVSGVPSATDKLMAVTRIGDTDKFAITGIIQDKMRLNGGSATIATVLIDATTPIAPPNVPPSLVGNIPDHTTTRGITYFFSPSNFFTDDHPETLALTASLSDGSPLPSWLTLTDGSLTGTPNSIETLMIKVTATDAAGASVSDIFKLSVLEQGTITEPMGPELTHPIPDQNAIAEMPFSYSFGEDVFTDPDNDHLTFKTERSDNSALPSWISFDSDTRTFSGTPALSDVGIISIKVTAEDPVGLKAFDTFEITVAPVLGLGENENCLVNVYPNPANDQINIEGCKHATSFEIIDSKGQKISSHELGEGTNSISTKDLAPGLYLLHFRDRNGGNVYSTRLVI